MQTGFWTPCGVAWAHRDGKGLNLQLAAGLAISGRVLVREVDAATLPTTKA